MFSNLSLLSPGLSKLSLRPGLEWEEFDELLHPFRINLPPIQAYNS
jgi:hypothetical protein